MAAGGSGPTYFDGLPLSGKQKSFIVLLVAGTLFEQIDLYEFAFIAPVLQKLWNLDVHAVGRIHSMFGIGAIIGCVLFGWLADKYGRKLSMSLALLLGGIGAVATSLAPNYSTLIMLRVISGIGISGALTVEAVMLSEMVPSNKRQKLQGILAFTAILGIPLIAIIAKKLLVLDPNNWRIVAAIPAASLIVFALFIMLVPESPRWLVSKNRYDDAKRVFKNITGGHELKLDPDFTCIVEKTSIFEVFKVMFKNREYIKRSLLFFFIFGFLFNAGFMIAQWLPTLLANEGFSSEVALSMQQKLTLGLPIGALLVAIFGEMGGRKYPYAIFMGIIATTLFILGITPLAESSLATISILVIIIGIFYITNQSISSIYCTECYPTRVRGLVYAFFLAIMRVGTVIAHDQIAPRLYETAGFNGYFKTLSLVYIVAVILLVTLGPKTAGKSLEELTTESVKNSTAA